MAAAAPRLNAGRAACELAVTAVRVLLHRMESELGVMLGPRLISLGVARSSKDDASTCAVVTSRGCLPSCVAWSGCAEHQMLAKV